MSTSLTKEDHNYNPVVQTDYISNPAIISILRKVFDGLKYGTQSFREHLDNIINNNSSPFVHGCNEEEFKTLQTYWESFDRGNVEKLRCDVYGYPARNRGYEYV